MACNVVQELEMEPSPKSKDNATSRTDTTGDATDEDIIYVVRYLILF